METEQTKQTEDIQKIETVINTEKEMIRTWADSSFDSDACSTEIPTGKNDMQGVIHEIETYKRIIDAKQNKNKSHKGNISTSEESKYSEAVAVESKEENQLPEDERGKQIKHPARCSCESCMYRSVRELKYRTDRNISMVMDDFMGRPPVRDLRRHPSDCICGAHMKNMIKGKRIPYAKIVEKIRENKFRPPK